MLYSILQTLTVTRWEHDLQDVELQQVRSYLHRLGLKSITLSFPSSLHNLARSVTHHYMAAIHPSGMRPPVPQCIPRPAAELADTTTANPLPSNLFSQAPRSSWPSNQPRLTNTDATSATVSHQQPPSQEHTREEATMYAQASSYIAEFDQRRGLLTAKGPHSPAPVPAPASSVGYQQGSGPLAIEPPPQSPKIMADHMSIRSIPGQDQQAGVSHNQQPQAWQKAAVHYYPTTQQQAQLGPSAFANGPTTSVVAPSQPYPRAAGQLPEGQRPPEAIISERQDTSGYLTNAGQHRIILSRLI